MFEGAGLLRIAYAINLIILVPVVSAMFFGAGVASVFDGKVTDSEGLRLLVGSLWFAILIASIIGFRYPAEFAPLLLVQILYKAVWLAAYVWPHREEPGLPWGITASFILIVVLYPILLLASKVWARKASAEKYSGERI